ncbi:type II secretion system protein [Sulfurovum sp.]|uniref:type II secretion system protein n=1 Tax=Sulfurovum sp. TaxID=1969726 RepID=UPI00356860A9
MKQLRPAFTIIEILVSVIILSIAIIPVLKVHTSNQEQIVYLTERNKRSLQDSLFLSNNILNYHQDNKTAYEVLEKYFKVKEQESREILKKTSRDVFIPDEIRIISLEEQGGPTAIVNEVMLKDKHSSIYHHFKLEGL